MLSTVMVIGEASIERCLRTRSWRLERGMEHGVNTDMGHMGQTNVKVVTVYNGGDGSLVQS